MEATWLTREQTQRVQAKNNLTALAMLRSALPCWSDTQRSALLKSCMRDWGTGCLVTANRLSQASAHILAAWDLSEHIAGLMLIRQGDATVPLYLHRRTLALKMQSRTALWVDFQPIKEAQACA
jgi:hypothetical protein